MNKGRRRRRRMCFGWTRIFVLGLVMILARFIVIASLAASRYSSSLDDSTQTWPAVRESIQTLPNAEKVSPELCLTPELDGKWVLDTPKTFADPICCEGDDRRYKRNTPPCGRQRPTASFEGQPNQLAYMRGRGCRCKNFTDTYSWKSAALEGSKWDAHEFCNLLGDRRIVLVGDSTMSQSSTILMNSVFPAGCQTNMKFFHSDTMIREVLGAWNRGPYWTDTFREDPPDIVIFSSGPHIYGDANFTRVINTMLADIALLRKTIKTVFVWKTQQPPGCTKHMYHEHPFVAARKILQEPLEWNHADFFDRDTLSIKIMQENNIPFLDLRMLYSRSDAHNMVTNDCMHFCAPGPLDIFPSLVRRMLLTNFSIPKCINSQN